MMRQGTIWTAFLVILAGVVSLTTGPARAACDGRLQHPGQVDVFAGEAYGVFAAGQQAFPVTVTVTAARPDCPFVVGFSSARDGAGLRMARHGQGSLVYRLSPDRRGTVRLRDVPGAQPAELLRGAARGRRASTVLTYFIVVDQGQTVPPGRYTDEVRVSLLDPAGRRRLETLTTRFVFDVPEALEARFDIDGSRRALGAFAPTLDFGILREGARRSFGLDIRANRAVTVMISSEGGGALHRLGAGPASTVPYRLRVDGQVHGGPGPLRLPADRGRTGRRRVDVQVIIGSTDRALAGPYKDTLQVTVSTR